MKSTVILLDSDSDLTAKLQAKLEREGFDIVFVSMDSSSIEEVALRIHTLLNQEKSKEASLLIGTITFIPEEHLLIYNDQETRLRNNENIILKALYNNRNRVVSKETLVAEIWNETDPKMKDHSLNNLIYTIREKLMMAPGIELKTIPKQGYKLSF
jgi:DNA-binding response OmpR family regulator